MAKERQVNQMTTPVEIAKAMYMNQRIGLMDSVLGKPQQTPNPETAQIKEIVRQIMTQSQI
tara:strand:- start:1003 stop:1185 length:183 start_codon:yes stop_codon:yes gene_type:complete